MAILQFIVFIESGCSPFGLLWALFSTQLIKKTYNAFEIWLLTGLTYILNGLFLELYPGKRIQTKYSLSLYEIFPTVLFNFVSTVLLTFLKLNENVTNQMYGSLYLISAGIGNELIYAPVHRLLHTSHFYKYHSLHHKQTTPRALGAIFCSTFEMWVANISSFLAPLYILNAPSSIFLIWIVSGIQTTQLHHSNKQYFWCFGNQPKFHDDHHKYIKKNYGNLGFLENFF